MFITETTSNIAQTELLAAPGSGQGKQFSCLAGNIYVVSTSLLGSATLTLRWNDGVKSFVYSYNIALAILNNIKEFCLPALQGGTESANL